MDSKEHLEKQLIVLKEKTGMGRGKISKDLGYNETYISEILGPNGSVSVNFLQRFESKYQNILKPPPPMNVQLISDDLNPDLIPLPKPYRDCDFLYRARGDSMYPKIPNGAEVGVRQITNLDVIISGEIYLIFTRNKLSTIKYIHTIDNDPEALDLVPYNEKAKTTRIKKQDIEGLFKVEFILILI